MQVRSKSTSQIWRPSKNPADAESQRLFSRTYLELNMRPKLCEPSHEAHQTSSFKTYLPNLTAFKKYIRRWTTGVIFENLSKTEYAAQTMWAFTRSPPNNFVQNIPPKSDGLQKFPPTLDHRFYFQGFIYKMNMQPQLCEFQTKNKQ